MVLMLLGKELRSTSSACNYLIRTLSVAKTTPLGMITGWTVGLGPPAC